MGRGLGSPTARGQGLDSGLGERWGDSRGPPGRGLRFLLEAGKPEGTGGVGGVPGPCPGAPDNTGQMGGRERLGRARSGAEVVCSEDTRAGRGLAQRTRPSRPSGGPPLLVREPQGLRGHLPDDAGGQWRGGDAATRRGGGACAPGAAAVRGLGSPQCPAPGPAPTSHSPARCSLCSPGSGALHTGVLRRAHTHRHAHTSMYAHLQACTHMQACPLPSHHPRGNVTASPSHRLASEAGPSALTTRLPWGPGGQ